MDAIVDFLSNPVVWKIILSYWIFSAFVGALPRPNGNKFYQFFFSFMHLLGGNINRAAIAFKVPGVDPQGDKQ